MGVGRRYEARVATHKSKRAYFELRVHSAPGQVRVNAEIRAPALDA
jgi:hypothetical protein